MFARTKFLLLGSIIVLAGIVVLARDLRPIPALAQTSRPNFLIVQADDLSLRALSLRIRRGGEIESSTPFIGRALREKGVEFTRFYANNPVCAPSRASLLSGQMSHNNGVLENGGGNGGFASWSQGSANSESLAPWLQEAGYRTAHIGKFMNGYEEGSPTPLGWKRWIGKVKTKGSVYYGYRLNIDGEITPPIGRRSRPDKASCKIVLPTEPRSCKHSTDVFTAYAAQEIRQASRQGAPFFLALNYNAPHDDGVGNSGPEPPTRLKNAISRVLVPRHRDDAASLVGKPRFMQANPPLNRELLGKRRSRLAREAASMLALDQSLQKLFVLLRKQQELQDTYIIFTSDNGFFSGEHRLVYGKFLPHNPSTKQPLLIRGPGISSGTVTSLASTIDIAPTVLDLAGVAPRDTDGISLKDALRGKSIAGVVPLRSYNRKDLLYPNTFVDGVSGNNKAPTLTYNGFVSERWKYIFYSYGEEELYDLERDPEEKTNLVGKTNYENILLWARNLARDLRDCSGGDCRVIKAEKRRASD